MHSKVVEEVLVEVNLGKGGAATDRCLRISGSPSLKPFSTRTPASVALNPKP